MVRAFVIRWAFHEIQHVLAVWCGGRRKQTKTTHGGMITLTFELSVVAYDEMPWWRHVDRRFDGKPGPYYGVFVVAAAGPELLLVEGWW